MPIVMRFTASRRQNPSSITASASAAPSVLFLDCDDTLYQDGGATMAKITEKINKYTAEHLGVSSEKAYALYKEHGTCLKGLLAEGLLDSHGVEEYLTEVHDIDYESIVPDPALKDILLRLQVPTWVFTASTEEHAQRCLQRLTFDDVEMLLRPIIDTRRCQLETKHSASSFAAAMAAAGATNPASCILCDDSMKNVCAAKAFGWQTVLVHEAGRPPVQCDEADFVICSLHELPNVHPSLFGRGDAKAPAPAVLPKQKRPLAQMLQAGIFGGKQPSASIATRAAQED